MKRELGALYGAAALVFCLGTASAQTVGSRYSAVICETAISKIASVEQVAFRINERLAFPTIKFSMAGTERTLRGPYVVSAPALVVVKQPKHDNAVSLCVTVTGTLSN